MEGGQQRASFAHGQDVLQLLNRDLANEMNTMLMFMLDSLVARGTDSLDVKQVATSFAAQDFQHLQKIAGRIVELEGKPQLMPQQIQDNASIDFKLPDGGAIEPILTNALENELQSVLELRNQVQNIAFTDPTTRTVLEDILADKEHQVEEIRNLLGI